jgi:hypothetical protein
VASISREEWPRSYQITGKQPCAGGATCLTAAGTGKDLFGRPQEMAGSAEMVQEAALEGARRLAQAPVADVTFSAAGGMTSAG